MPGLRLLLTALVFAAAPAAAAATTETEAVAWLPPEAAASIRAAADASPRPPLARLEWLVEHLFAAEGLGFEYDNSRTRSVAETLAERRGNCLSFTLTFVALARAIGLDARLQETERNQIWLRDDDTLFHARHVNAVVRIGHRRFVADFDRDLPLLRARAQIVDEARGIAHYFNNRGAESMAAGEPAAAGAFFARAIALDPGLVSTWNNRGVLRLRGGDAAGAETDWRHALRLEPAHLPALANLAALYRRQGRTEILHDIETRLERARHRDPFHHFVLGLRAERAAEPEQALGHYRAAARLRRDEPLFVLSQARMLEALGRTDAAARLRTRIRRDVGTPDSVSEPARSGAGRAGRPAEPVPAAWQKGSAGT